jgi:hypothetical protein
VFSLLDILGASVQLIAVTNVRISQRVENMLAYYVIL